MSFEVFRRHQKKMLAVFAILAMFGFVVSDSLPRLLSSNASGRDQPIVKLYGKMLHQSELNEMLTERSLANRFLFRIFPYFGPEPFGSLKTRDLVDAVILRHEADRLGIPAGHEVGKDFLMRVTHGRMNADTFQLLMMDFHNQVSRRAGPLGHRRPGPAELRPGRVELPRPAAGRPDGHPLRHLPGLSRPEREGLGQARGGARGQVPRQGARALGGGDPVVLRQVQGHLARPDAVHPRIQGPPPGPGRDPLGRRQRPGPIPQGRAHRRGAPGGLREPQVGVRGQGRSDRPAGRPLRRPPRADSADHPAVQRGPIDPRELAVRGEGAVRDRRAVRQDQDATCSTSISTTTRRR